MVSETPETRFKDLTDYIPLSKTKLVSRQTFWLKATCLSRTRRSETWMETDMKHWLLGLEHHQQQM